MGVGRRKEEAPASLESLHRKIMGAAHAVEREVSTFVNQHLGKPEVKSEEWHAFLQELCAACEKEPNELQDCADLEHFLQLHKDKEKPLEPKLRNSGKTNRSKLKEDKAKADVKEENPDDDEKEELRERFSSTSEYKEILTVCERGKLFDYVAFSLKNQITDACSRLQTYCLSFEPETKGVTVHSVEEYENRIIGWKEDIHSKMDAVDKLLDEHDKYKQKAMSYIAKYSAVVNLMRQTCKNLISVCDPVKKWVTSDSTYARRIQEEINVFNRQKAEHQNTVRYLDDQREKMSMMIKRKAFQVSNFEKEIDKGRDEKRNLRRREVEMQDSLSKYKADTKRKRRDLEEAKKRFINRSDNSAASYNYIHSVMETLKQEVRQLESKCSTLQQNVVGLQRDEEVVQRGINQLERTLREHRQAHEQLYRKLEEALYSHYKTTESFTTVEGKITALKRIREIKLHVNTIKKIFHFGYHPGNMEDRDELKDAMKIVSEEVGKDWPYLYQKLPFAPPRDFERRSLDIEVIDLSTRRVQSGGFRTVTIKSLEKWRRLSHAASLPDLVKTLKRLRKGGAVRRIQKEVMVSSPVARKRHPPIYNDKIRKSVKSCITV